MTEPSKLAKRIWRGARDEASDSSIQFRPSADTAAARVIDSYLPSEADVEKVALHDQLKALAENATPGPWLIRTLDNFGWNVVNYTDGDKFRIARAAKCGHEPDAALIAALRNNLPTILAALRGEA
mgnify:CR=1 FL=1